MSNRLLNSAWKISDITPAAKLVLLRLADRADADGKCFPGHDSIASDCNLSERSVRGILPELAKAGHLTIKREAQRGFLGQSVFSYTIHPTPENPAAVTPEAVAAVEASDTGKSFLRHRKLTVATPENPANPIYITPIEPSVNPKGKVLVFPSHLQSPAFKTAWAEWEAYRKSFGKVKNFSFAFRQHIKTLTPHTEAEAIQMIGKSIAKSWTDLYPPNQENRFNNKKQSVRPIPGEAF